MGNLGGSSTVCSSKRLGNGMLPLYCYAGEIQVDGPDAVAIGVMSSAIEEKIYCTEASIWAVEKNK